MFKSILVMLMIFAPTLSRAAHPVAKKAPAAADSATKAAGGATASAPVAVAVAAEPPLLAGNQITIVRWDAASKTMIVALTNEPAVGPNISTIHDLLDAIDFEDSDQRKKFIASPNLLKGLTFTLKKNLKLIPYVPGAKNVPAEI